MRHQGKIKTWNEAKGFGFMVPDQGGQDIFVHISALPREVRSPAVGQSFTFEIELNPDGKKRATRVQAAGHSHAAYKPVPTSASRTSEEGGKRWPSFTTVFALVVLMTVALLFAQSKGWLQNLQALPFLDKGAVSESADASPDAVPQPSASPSFSCDGRTHCSQMRSCDEAKFFLANCPGVEMDGDHDSIPCEQQFCGG